MISSLDNFDIAFLKTHSALHPPNSILRNLFVFIPIPNSHRMRVIGIGKTPGMVVVVKDL